MAAEAIRAPGGEDLRRPDVRHHVKEVVTHKNPSLQQQEGEADAIPDDPCLVFGQLTQASVSWEFKNENRDRFVVQSD